MTTSAPPSSRRRSIARPVGVLIALLLALAGCGGSSKPAAPPATSSPPPPTAVSTVRTADPALKPPGMATVAESALPDEARDVIHRIDTGGPFKYRQDGVAFQNRERRLPTEPSGYYREYTVATPGSPDRGARRLVLGREGQLYYTPDHYRSFQWVVRGGTR